MAIEASTGEVDKFSPRVLADQETVIVPERSQIDMAVDFYAGVAARAGIRGFETMAHVYNGQESISPDVRKALKIAIDNNAVATANEDFQLLSYGDTKANFETDVPVAEGEKERRKSPDEAVETGKGTYKPDVYRIARPIIRVSGAADWLEGTGNLADKKPRSISMFAGVVDGKVHPVRGEEEAQYREMLVAGARMKGKLDLEAPLEDNIWALVKAYDLSHPRDLTMRILGGLDRPRNFDTIERAGAMGVKVRQLESCDAAVMIETMLSDEPVFYAGSGGKEESTVTGIFAYGADALWQAQDVMIDPDTKLVTHRFPEIWKPEDIVDGDPENVFFVAAGVTGEPYLGLEPIKVKYDPSGNMATWNVDVLKASASKAEIETIRIHSS